MLFYHWLFPTRALQSPHPSPPLPCITIPPPLSSPPLHYNPPTPLLPSLALQSPYPSPSLPCITIPLPLSPSPFRRD